MIHKNGPDIPKVEKKKGFIKMSGKEVTPLIQEQGRRVMHGRIEFDHVGRLHGSDEESNLLLLHLQISGILGRKGRLSLV